MERGDQFELAGEGSWHILREMVLESNCFVLCICPVDEILTPCILSAGSGSTSENKAPKQSFSGHTMHKSSTVFVQNMRALAEFSHSQWGRCFFTSAKCTATLSMFHLFTAAGISKEWMLAQHAHLCAATDRRLKLCLSTAKLCFYYNQSNAGLLWGGVNCILFQWLMWNKTDCCSIKYFQFKQKSLNKNV